MAFFCKNYIDPLYILELFRNFQIFLSVLSLKNPDASFILWSKIDFNEIGLLNDAFFAKNLLNVINWIFFVLFIWWISIYPVYSNLSVSQHLFQIDELLPNPPPDRLFPKPSVMPWCEEPSIENQKNHSVETIELSKFSLTAFLMNCTHFLVSGTMASCTTIQDYDKIRLTFHQGKNPDIYSMWYRIWE